jgi:hypothetical protein
MLEIRGKGDAALQRSEGVFSGLGGRRRHTLQDNLILQARVFTLKGVVAPSASTTPSARSDPASDGDAVQGLLREPGPSRRLGRLPLGPRPSIFQGRQPDPRPRLIDSGIDPADGQPGSAPANQVPIFEPTLPLFELISLPLALAHQKSGRGVSLTKLEEPQTTRPIEPRDSYASGIRIPHSSP